MNLNKLKLEMIKIYIVDDHTLVIQGISSLLQNEAEITVCGCSNTAAACINFFENNSADVILMDINLPDMNGLDLCKIVKQAHPSIKVLALSTFNQSSYITKMMASGASGYLLKNTTKEELTEAIKTVVKGDFFYSFEVGEIVKAAKEKQNTVPILTKREIEVLKLVAEGFTNMQITEKLFISIDTVDSHRKNLYTKLNVNNTALLMRYAIENNLV